MDFFERLKQRPWNSHAFRVPVHVPEWFTRYPTMLTLEEMRMLSWVVANAPEGDVLDMGSFLGGSTVSLAHGMKAAGKNGKIHSYDVFEIDEPTKQRFYYNKGYGFYSGSDTLPLFSKLTGYYGDIIIPYKGDILNEKCPSSIISVMFIDLSKSWQINDYILSEFFTKMKIGSIIVQQDLIYFQTPWLCSTMEKLGDKVELLSYTQDHSVVYGVRKDITASDVQPCLSKNTSKADVHDSILAMKDRFSDLRQREMMDALLASYDARPDAQNAWEFPNSSCIDGSPLRL